MRRPQSRTLYQQQPKNAGEDPHGNGRPRAHDDSSWNSAPGRALHIAAVDDIEVSIEAADATIATLRISGGVVSLDRHEHVVEGYAQSYAAVIEREGPHQIVIDHGTIEVFAGNGSTTMSALVFPGAEWTVRVDGDASLAVI